MPVEDMPIDIATLAADAVNQNEKPVLTLADVRKLGADMERLDREATDLEGQASDKRAQLRDIADRILPDGLQSLKLKGLTLDDGVEIALSDIVAATINETNRNAAHQWLRDNGHGDLIKNEVNIVFGKGEDEYANDLMSLVKTLREANTFKCGSVEQKEKVHPQTLQAFVREQIRDSKPLPLDTFKVFMGTTCKLKRPKAKL